MMNTARFFSSQQESSTILGSILHAKQITTIHKKVIKIDSILKDSFLLRKKLQNTKSIKKSQLDFAEKEKNLEKTKIKKPEKEIKKVSTPNGGGIFGWIGNFINNVIFGFLVIRFIKYLPKLLTLIPVINGAIDGIVDWGGKILNGLVTFIDWGYSAYDNTVKIFSKFGGEGAAKKFEDFMSKFQNVLQVSFIAGMLFSDLALSGGGGGGGIGDVVGDVTTEVVVDQVKKQVVRQVGAQAARSAAVPVAGAIGIIVGAGLLASALGEGAFQLKKFSKKIEKDAFKKRDELKKTWKKTPAWNILAKAWNLVQYSFFETYVIPGIRLTNWMLNGIGVTLDIIGAPFRYAIELIRWALMALNNDTKGMAEQRKNLGKFDARIRDGIREHFAGFLGPIFRVIGRKDWADKIEKQGSWGSLYGDKAVKDMYGYASGGSTRGGQYSSATPRREVKTPRRTRRTIIKPAKLYQGRTVGGIDNIQKVFPEPEDIKSPSGTPSQRKEETMNPYGFMSKSYYRFASVPFIGPILAMPLKVMMGDSIDSSYYTSIGQGFDNLMGKAYDEGALSKDFPIQDFDFEKIISKSVQQLASKEMVSVRSELMRQLGLEKLTIQAGRPSGDCPCPETGSGTGSGGGSSASYGSAEERALLDAIAYAEGTAGPNGYRTMFGGGLFNAPPWQHPNKVIDGGRYQSAAAGRYQFMPNTWNSLGLPDFSPINQDKGGIQLARNRGVTGADLKREGLSDRLIAKLSGEWASFPTLSGRSYYGQPIKRVQDIRQRYQQSLTGGSSTALTGPTGSSQISSSSPASNVSDCSCDGDNIPGTNGLNIQTSNIQDNTTGDSNQKKIFLHWTAGEYSDSAPGPDNYGYHTYIKGPSGTPVYYKPYGTTPPEGPYHTYKKNTPNAASISASGMKNAQEDGSWGRQPITAAQWGSMATEAAKLALKWGWKSSDINDTKVRTHSEEYRDNRVLYGSEYRWDVNRLYSGDPKNSGGDKIRSMIKAKMGSAGRFGGGPINEGLTKVHPGEFVIDKDSVDAFGVEFISIINQVENKSQLRRVKESLIQILREKVPFYSNRSQDQYILVSSSNGRNAPNGVIISNNSGNNNVRIDSCPWKDVMEFGN